MISDKELREILGALEKYPFAPKEIVYRLAAEIMRLKKGEQNGRPN